MEQQDNSTALIAAQESGMSFTSMMEDDRVFDRMMTFAKIMATGKATIPEALRNEGDCLAITMQAMSWRMNPISVAQKTFIISGKLGYEAQLVAAAINGSGVTTGTFNFEWFGQWENVIGKFTIKTGDKGEYRVPGWKLADEVGLGVRVSATLKGESEPRVLELLLAQARTRNSTMWADDPKQQLAYLAQKKWARLFAPGVILGVYTPDELQEIVEKDVTPENEKRPRTGAAVAEAAVKKGNVIDPELEERRAMLIGQLEDKAALGTAEFTAAWKAMGKANKNDAYLVGEPEYARIIGVAQAIDSTGQGAE